MHIEHLFLGKPKTHQWEGREISTSIFRNSVEQIEIKDSELLGSKQADNKHHGGKFKQVYSYALEDYSYWKDLLGEDFEIGALGENITTSGFSEQDLFVGDQFRFGKATLEVVQPRVPCLNLNVRLNRKDAMKLFLKAQKYGVYFKVIKDGLINKGDKIKYLGNSTNRQKVKLLELVPIVLGEKCSDDLRQRVLSLQEMDPRIINSLMKTHQ